VACERKHFEVAKYLLEHGADANIQDNVSTVTCGVAVMAVVVGSVG
jgi:hypothetical protein